MSIRLAVYQRENRPLDGLCAQLQCAGYDVFERYTENAMIEAVDDLDIDVLLLDADGKKTTVLVETIRNRPRTSHLPIMLIAEETSTSLDRAFSDMPIDDMVVLPVPRDDLRSRVRNMARLASMTTELERRYKALSAFGIDKQGDWPGATADGLMQILLAGPMGDEQVALIDMLDDTATFTHALTTDQTWHCLRQSYVDMIIISSEVALDDARALCRRIRATRSLTDLPILIAADEKNSPAVEALCRDEHVELLRAPYQPTGMRKRLRVMVRQHHLKHQLRGMMANGLGAATVDNLTGLSSRSFLYHYLEGSIQESRERGSPLSVATCTISGLGRVNDMLGYPIGDQLISHLAKALVTSCRAQDLIARASGASFCIVLNDTSESEAAAVCRRVSEILKEIAGQSDSNRLSNIQLDLGMAELAADDTAETFIARTFRQPTTVALRQAS